MPTTPYPIGTILHHHIWGNGIIIGYKHLGLSNYHIYFKEHDIYMYKHSDDTRLIELPTELSILNAQTIVGHIPTRKQPDNARLQPGTIIYRKRPMLPSDFESIVLDVGHKRSNGSIYYLEATHTVNINDWIVDYYEEPFSLSSKRDIIIEPTAESIKLAKTLLFEHVISHAFTTF